MPECQDWEWKVIPCDCALKHCQHEVATQHLETGLWIEEMHRNEFITTLQAVGLQTAAADAAMLGYVECKLVAEGCKGTRENPRFTPREKLALNRASNASWNQCTSMGFTAIGVAAALGDWGALAAVPFGGIAAYGGFQATSYNNLALDPPDPNFTILAQPELPVPPTILAGSGIDGPTADALNEMLTNQAFCVGTGQAVVVSINRASGAEVANSPVWRDRQLEAARGFARAWSDELAKAGPLRSEVASQLGALGIGATGLDIVDIIQVVDDIMNNGWPQSFRDLLGRYGIRGAAQADALQRFTTNLANLKRLTASPIDMFTDTEYTSSEEDAIAAIAHFGNG
jgi:hypothetical protein